MLVVGYHSKRSYKVREMGKENRSKATTVAIKNK